MKKIIVSFVLILSFLLYGCNKTAIVFTKDDFLKTFNTRIEEEGMNEYMLVSLDINEKAKDYELFGVNRVKNLQVSLTYDASENLTKFGLLTAKITDEDFNKIIKMVKESFVSSDKYNIKEGISVDTGHRGIAYFIKEEK